MLIKHILVHFYLYLCNIRVIWLNINIPDFFNNLPQLLIKCSINLIMLLYSFLLIIFFINHGCNNIFICSLSLFPKSNIPSKSKLFCNGVPVINKRLFELNYVRKIVENFDALFLICHLNCWKWKSDISHHNKCKKKSIFIKKSNNSNLYYSNKFIKCLQKLHTVESWANNIINITLMKW